MKIKNIVYLPISLLLVTAPAQLTSQSTREKVGNVSQQLGQESLDFQDVLRDETPLQLSTRNIRDFFKGNALPTINLKGRVDDAESRTSQFTQSFVKYVKEMYNKQGYAQMLSQDGAHIVDFLSLSNELNLDCSTVYVSFRLFYNKIKSCELIDDTVILQILNALPDVVEKHFDATDQPPKNDLSFIKKHSEEMMLAKFTEHFADFQREPDMFISHLSEDLAASIKKELERLEKSMNRQQEEKEIRERLRQTIIKFFETAISKTIWNIKSSEGIWSSFISIANNLQLLGVHSIIDHMDDLDDLLWSLVHRFCYFLDLTGATLPLSFYEELESDLEHKVIYFLEAQEQDEGIKTKKETLIESLIQGKTKAIAFQRGLVGQHI